MQNQSRQNQSQILDLNEYRKSKEIEAGLDSTLSVDPY